MSPQEISLLLTHRPSASTAVLLLTLLLCRGYSQDGPVQQIVALLGDDAVLPCFLKTPVDASDMQLEWARTDLAPGFIYVWEKDKENMELKQASYVGRTSLSSDRVKHGDVSLTLSKVQLSDEGPYRCFIPQLGQRSHVDLVVGSVSAPVIKVISNHSSRVVLQCESAGWYPEPELLWLDGEGNLLPAGPTETLRGPDDLYTVSSRVTVEKRHSNNITCRVQQKNISQSRETHIHVPGSVMKQRSATFIIVVVCLLYVCAVIALVWNCALKICPRKPDPEKNEGEELKSQKQKHSRAPADNTESKELKEEPPSEQLENHPTDPDTSEEIQEEEKKEETETQTAAQADLPSCES
ncbi:butyrophilin subfamily 2 member A2-like [Archocentrus centrarchus]|uniref:butyrophilin subfamily 2 member A2-like n=1 Tax=Archocentrus centrarchus TaxID=63155 RepID=UPI0011EA1D1E|nr:butyrophilin subfamily 2 member A2-like [Archocentrus centrarchus]XP_030608915.1 butyrophilin subfamily 2 member A2-like [Archocentrus centrarchus]